jgi:hypothetical protein
MTVFELAAARAFEYQQLQIRRDSRDFGFAAAIEPLYRSSADKKTATGATPDNRVIPG